MNMEYLPDDPNEKETQYKEKIQNKLKDFRQYIVDKGVVLAFTKVLLSLKYSENRPKNPNRIIREFFGKYIDSSVDKHNSLNEEILILKSSNTKLYEKVLELEDELEIEKRKYRKKNLFNSFYESDSINNKNNQISTKLIIEKLTGNKKFEVDEKLNLDDFINIIDNLAEGDEEIIDSLLSNFEIAIEGDQIYKDDLDNIVYKKLVQIFKDLKKGGKK